jgi:HlyD family secretion protein
LFGRASSCALSRGAKVNNRIKKVAAACLGVIIVVPGLAWLALRQGHTPTQVPTSSPANSPIAVHAVRPEKGGLERTVSRPASIHAFQHAQLFAKVSGYLQHQTVDIGSVVKNGQLLARIFAPEIEAGVQKAHADLSKAQSLVDVAKARVAASQADLTRAQAQLDETRADLESAKATLVLRKKEYHRLYSLAAMKAVEQELVDEKLAAEQSAEAAERAAVKAISTAQAAVDAAGANVKRAQADLKNAQAEVQVRRAELDQARALDEYTYIRAPFDGVITERNFHDGDFIRDAANGATAPLLAIADDHVMRVIVWVPDDVVPFVRVADAASIIPFAIPNRTFQGKVARMAASENYNSRTMRVEVDLPNPERLLTDGMYGSGTIFLGKNPNALTVPSACLVGAEEKSDERALYVVRGGKAQRVTVHIGLQDGIHAEVLGGLKADDQVIKGAGPGVTDGTPVQVVEG